MGDVGSTLVNCCREDGMDCTIATDFCPTNYVQVSSGGCGDTGLCDQFKNACCGPDGQCSSETADGSCPGGYTQQASGTTCSTPGICPGGVTLACCSPNGQCYEESVSGICPSGWTEMPSGSVCSSTLCNSFRNACCGPAGQCQTEDSSGNCPSGYQIQSSGSFCSSTLCNNFRNACCGPEGQCQQEDFDGSCPSGWTRMSDGSTCNPGGGEICGTGACLHGSLTCYTGLSYNQCDALPSDTEIFLLGELECPSLGNCCDTVTGLCRDTYSQFCNGGDETFATYSPTHAPVAQTNSPTNQPTLAPTDSPTSTPTDQPTKAPTNAPTRSPTEAPSSFPTKAPTNQPTLAPTDSPSDSPSKAPTDYPTKPPTSTPTSTPTKSPTDTPTFAPTDAPICPSLYWEDNFCDVPIRGGFDHWKDSRGGSHNGVKRRKDASRTCANQRDQLMVKPTDNPPQGTFPACAPAPCDECSVQIKGKKNKLPSKAVPLGGCINTVQVYFEFELQGFENRDVFYFEYTFDRSNGWATRTTYTFQNLNNNESYKSSIAINTAGQSKVWLRFFNPNDNNNDKVHIGKVVVQG